MEIIRTTSDDPRFKTLVQLLNKELWDRYSEEMKAYQPHNKIENNHHVVIAVDEGKSIGCGCFKEFDKNSVEIKRMYVLPEWRGRKVAGAILSELEAWAIEEGVKRIVLETGVKQPEAIRLYQRLGYSRIENYEPYVGMDRSVCMEKRL